MKAEDLNRAMEYIDDKYLALAETPHKECQKMSKKKVMRIVLIAAVAAMLSLTAYAADFLNIRSLVSYGDETYEHYSDVERVRKSTGLQMDVVETFSNGYTFQNVSVRKVEAMDENDRTVFSYPAVSVTYKNAAGNRVLLDVHGDREELGEGEHGNVEKRTINGITVSRFLDNYLLVPGDYQLSAEEETWGEIPGNYISYGSDTVERESIAFVTWSKDGIFYDLMDAPATEDADALFAMAEELLNR